MPHRKSPSPEKSAKAISYLTLQSTSIPPASPKRTSDSSLLLKPPPLTRTQSPKTLGDPAALLIEAEKLQKAFIDTLPFRSAETRMIQLWLSNWFGYHVDCPELDKLHLASLTKVTWDGKALRSLSKEMLFVDLMRWGFSAGDATPLVEDIEEARGYWNRVCRLMKERCIFWFTGQCMFLVIQLLRAWWKNPFTADFAIMLFQQWLVLIVLLQFMYVNVDLLSNYFMRWEFWNLQKRHIDETHV